jgi:hypothetical protein
LPISKENFDQVLASVAKAAAGLFPGPIVCARLVLSETGEEMGMIITTTKESTDRMMQLVDSHATDDPQEIVEQTDRLTEAAKRLSFQSIETLPWELSTEFNPPQKAMPRGIVLRNSEGGLTLIGDDCAGFSTRGCSCCAQSWSDEITCDTEWAWLI